MAITFHDVERLHTKETAETLLRDLPSVLGAFVREDINGHPREIHLLIAPGPSVKLLAQDVRELLEEKLGIPIDHRVISIAQLAEDAITDDDVSLDNITETAKPEPRLHFGDVVSEVRDQRVCVRARLKFGEQSFEAEATELDAGNGRLRAAALATLQAAAQASAQDIRLELDSVTLVKAFDREYVLVSVLAGGAIFGRQMLHLAGAQPIEYDVETAAALATLKAINRNFTRLLVKDSADG